MIKTTEPWKQRRQLFKVIVRYFFRWEIFFLASIVLLLPVSVSWAGIPSCEISDYEIMAREIGDVPEPYHSMGLKMVRCYFFSKDHKDEMESIYFQCLFKPTDGKLMPVGMGHVDDLIFSRKTQKRLYIWRFAFDKDWGVNWANYMEMDGRMVEVATRIDSEDYRERVQQALKGIFIQMNSEPYYEEAL